MNKNNGSNLMLWSQLGSLLVASAFASSTLMDAWRTEEGFVAAIPVLTYIACLATLSLAWLLVQSISRLSNGQNYSDKDGALVGLGQIAMQKLNTNVMIANTDNVITYMNESVHELFEERETILKREIAGFDASKLLGSNMDVFHKNPNHQRGIVNNLQDKRSSTIVIAGLSLKISTTPLFDEDGNKLGTAVEWADLTAELADADAEIKANSRIKQALDSASSAIMLADSNNNINYINRTADELFRKIEPEIRQSLPAFSINSLLGQNMDVFHKNPAHQRSMIGALSSRQSSEIKLGPLSFGMELIPLTSKHGERLGTIIEWKDRTKEIALQSEVKNVLERISQGDLTQKMEGNYEGFFESLKNSINKTIDNLTQIVHQIKGVTEAVAVGSEEICQGNANLSQRTEEQASSLEQTSATMEEMTSTVKQNAGNAQEADSLAQGAKDKAEHGGDVVGKAVIAMAEINGSSKRIADIISVIDEIAFQTNLLALNASVEAARAGEQGRGFAVVASEVRNLAGRSATAAKEIKDLIQDSVIKVEQGSKLVDESGKTLEEIIEAIQKVTNIVGDISKASDEQATGIEEVNKAISMMDEMTQQNAALVEQAAAASETMGDKAEELKGQINFFSLSNSTANRHSMQMSGKAAATNQSAVMSSARNVSYTDRKPALKQSKKSQPAPAALPSSSEDWEEF